MDVDCTLFPRKAMNYAGIAPLTSMFYFSPGDDYRADDVRQRVRHRDGLSIWNGKGEHIWRPLINPSQNQFSSSPIMASRGSVFSNANAGPIATRTLTRSMRSGQASGWNRERAGVKGPWISLSCRRKLSILMILLRSGIQGGHSKGAILIHPVPPDLVRRTANSR